MSLMVEFSAGRSASYRGFDWWAEDPDGLGGRQGREFAHRVYCLSVCACVCLMGRQGYPYPSKCHQMMLLNRRILPAGTMRPAGRVVPAEVLVPLGSSVPQRIIVPDGTVVLVEMSVPTARGLCIR